MAGLLLLLEGLSWLGGRHELAVRLDPQGDGGGGGDERQVFDPLLFWRLRPHLGGRVGPPITNRLGLRGPELTEKAPGELRILSLGESTTFAGVLPYRHCYSARLEAQLAGASRRPLRVINAGVPGYSSFQGLQYLLHRGVALEPDAVLFYFGYNDFLPVAHRARRDRLAEGGARGQSDRELFEARRRLRFRLTALLLEQSNGFRLLFSRVASRARGPLQRDPGRPRVPEPDRLAVLEELLAFCRRRELDLAILVPWYRDFERHAPLLRRFARRHGLPLVDLPAALSDLPGARGDYFRDAVHPNARGHREMARAMAAVLAPAWGLAPPAGLDPAAAAQPSPST